MQIFPPLRVESEVTKFWMSNIPSLASPWCPGRFLTCLWFGKMWPEHETDHSLQFIAEFNNTTSFNSAPSVHLHCVIFRLIESCKFAFQVLPLRHRIMFHMAERTAYFSPKLTVPLNIDVTKSRIPTFPTETWLDKQVTISCNTCN
jgi:hypothetical protein